MEKNRNQKRERRKQEMKKIRMTVCLLTAALVAAAFAGCGDTSAKTVDISRQPEQGQAEAQKERGSMAKVVSLNGDRLTVVLADMSDGGGREGTPPAIGQEQTDSQTSQGGSASPDGNSPSDGALPPGGGNGQSPASGPDGPDVDASGPAFDGTGAPAGSPGQPGQGGREIKFTGGEVTYTLSGDVAIMKGQGESATEIDLSELAADDVIRFTTTDDDDGNEVIDAIVVME